MKVTVSNEQKFFPINAVLFSSAVKHFFALEKIKTDEVIIHFVTSRKIISLHRTYFNDPTLTDCITFPIDDNETVSHHILGEIFICPAFAFDYLKKKKRACEKRAINGELLLYLVHGLLHLIGYDDQDPKCRKKMRRRESFHLAHLRDQHLQFSACLDMNFL